MTTAVAQKTIHEVRLHGRGGQGAVLASKILAKAIAMSGLHVTAIPSFGFERRGAPVAAFMRYSEKPLRAVTNIYDPDYIICIDPSIPKAVDIFAGVQPGSTLIQATRHSAESLNCPEPITKVVLCDAVGIGMEVFRRPITNTIMLGAFARATGIVTMDALRAGLESANFRDAGLEQNLIAIERGYNEAIIKQRQGEEWV
ncbi:NADH-dependent phenylglyoxylate dehydrogenase subunit gamma [Sedimenticola selenatireducens]|jgi:2-oxoacid:acceptor oxidoreductase gamma subunit (pyruvate/2-ketoisovalerate family)|uniref:NADH-dependent phenylglyoxylate dehydrogenase subunit gamma n=1 Tax=Sedimenticola selenatireducens TaxID=191960 RepID=UPI002FF562E0